MDKTDFNILENYQNKFFNYPYLYQNEAMGIALFTMLIFSLLLYLLYKLITCKMKDKTKAIFQGFIILSVILSLAFFFVEISLSLISIYQVNKQLGFSYATPATPATPEGEFF